VVMQSLEKERENRFASASAFLTALEEAERLTGEGRDLTPPPLGTPAPMPLSGFAPRPSIGERPALPPAGENTAPAAPRRRALVGAVGVAIALVLAALALPKALRTKTVAHGPVTKPAPASSELAARLRAVEGLLAEDEIVKARLSLEQLLSENPRNGRVRYLMGRVAFADDHHAEAIADYRQAIELDAGFRGDPVVLEHLGVALGESKVADTALDVAIEQVGRPAADLLVKVANGNGEVRRRERAARALDELGEGRRVDLVALHMAELKRAGTCEEKKPLVVALGKSDDLRALPALRAQRQRGGLDGLLGNDPPVGCMKTELADAITRLEAKLPADKRPAPPPPAGTHRSSARSFFRGR